MSESMRVRRPRARPVVSPIQAWWAVSTAVGGAALMWSGRFYQPLPLYVPAVAGFGLVGALIGTVPLRCGWITTRTRVRIACTIALLPMLTLIGLGAPEHDEFFPDPWPSLNSYRGGCLAGTVYTGPDATLSQETKFFTLTSNDGRSLRFTRTGRSWPSLDRAELLGEGVTPATEGDRNALAAVGCS